MTTSCNESQVYALVLGRTLAQLRERRGWTQATLADRLDLAQASLSRFEQGQVQPEPYMLRKLAQRFDLAEEALTRYVALALERTEAAARQVTPASNRPWWETALKMGGRVGVAGLVTFAVSTTLTEHDKKGRRSHEDKRRSQAS